MFINKKFFSLNIITLALFPFYVSAASSSAWVAENGAVVTADDNYTTTTQDDVPLRVNGENSLLITDLGTVFTSAADATDVAQVTDKGTLQLNRSSLYAQKASSNGIKVTDGTLEMNGGLVGTAGGNNNGILATQNSNITLNNAQVALSGINSVAINLSGGTLTANDIGITSGDAGNFGIRLEDGTVAKVDNAKIALGNAGARHSLYILNSTFEGKNVVITSAATAAAAIRLDKGSNTTDISSVTLTDSSINAADVGVRVMNGVLTLNNVDVNSVSHAVDVNQDEGTVLIDGGSYTTTGDEADALIVMSDQALLTATNTRIATQGDNATAVAALLGTAIVKDSELSTTGDYAYGLYSHGSVEGEGLTITTSGISSHAVVAALGGETTARESVIHTRGDNSVGLFAMHNSTVNADGVDLRTEGVNAHGMRITYGGALNVSNSIITAEQAEGLYVIMPSPANEPRPQATLDNVALTSANSTAILAGGTNGFQLTLKNNTTVSGGNGEAIRASAIIDDNPDVAPVYANITTTAAGQVRLLGDVVTDSYENRIDLSLADGSELHGATQNVNSLALDDSSVWLMSADSNVKTLKQNGHVIFKRGGDYRTLTVDGDLSGNGNFTLNTHLGGDDSPSDKVHVKGKAEGSYNVTFTNTDGAGAQTDAGIKVIQVDGDTQGATFTQAGRAVAGNYEYYLNKVGNNDWYLQASYAAVEPEEEAVTPPIDDGNSGNNQNKPDNNGGNDQGNKPDAPKTYRAETAGYLMTPYLNAAYGFMSVGAYHQRMGAYRDGQGAWGRVYGRHDSFGADRFGYDVNSSYIQLGGDVYNQTLSNGWQAKAGPMITLGRQNSANQDYARRARAGLSVNTGHAYTTAYGVGGYFTALHDDGTYVDTVAQLTRYSNRLHSDSSAKLDSYGLVVSGEVGKPYTLSGRVKIEPQAQLMVQYMNVSQTESADVKLNDQNFFIGQARGGMRLFYDGTRAQPYLKADMVQQIGATPGIMMNSERLKPDVHKAQWQAGAGVSANVDKNLRVYAEGQYSHTFSKGIEGYTGSLGLEYKF
ncbi:autotransporter family protein [Erwinia oleae]|uniref:autotransporter family protein n=1 Tax=Erwinia oleae TaxID=796334 RepID=UPI0005535BFD|nr:autotransporter outer membrane beta-barrel domain-containing protein [Erwinia oleae]